MRRGRPGLATIAGWIAGAGLLGLSGQAGDPAPGLAGDEPARAQTVEGSEGGEAAYAAAIVPFLRRYCGSCHGPDEAKGDLSFEDYPDVSSVLEDDEIWEYVARRLHAREMPPRDRPQPSAPEIERVVDWIREEIGRARLASRPDPGRVTIRRLNRREYSNTIRDLLDVEYDAGSVFPSDDVGYGFDNIGDVLSLPPILLEKYLDAAETIAGEAMKPDSESLRRILVCRPAPDAEENERADCLRRIARRLASRAYRRPVSAEEARRLAELGRRASDGGGAFEDEVRLVLQAILVSPHFLFRVELDPDAGNPEGVHAVTDFELASRLSYFLWSSMPDRELRALARKGTLHEEAQLGAQVNRMLRDPRSRALLESFALQWLQVGRLESAAPDPELFPGFDEELRDAMSRETSLFFETIVREDRSVLELLDADYTFVNERLARHYGLRGVEGSEFRRVSLEGSPRGGVLTMASVLTATSNPTRTSPVKRGKWVLEVLLGTPPPPPPADVPDLSEQPEGVLSGSLRERMEQHRADPGCATCHSTMDPLGFGLENFDAVGAWREKDGPFPIDASGELPDGRSFRGPRELRSILEDQSDTFRRALSESLLTYALGRGLERYDRPAVDQIAAALKDGGDRFSALVLAVVKSAPFLMRRGDRGKP